jgi:hypothetical protein
VVRRDGEQWKVTAGPLRFPADQPILDSTLKVLESFQAQKIVAYGKTAKLESFGLHMPADTLKIEVRGESSGCSSKSLILRFGKAAEGGGRYLLVPRRSTRCVCARRPGSGHPARAGVKVSFEASFARDLKKDPRPGGARAG